MDPTRLVIALVIAAGCSGKQTPVENPENSTEAPAELPPDIVAPIGGDIVAPVGADTPVGSGDPAAACPPPVESDKMCAQVQVWAHNPAGGCCAYATPCKAPEGWTHYGTPAECSAAAAEAPAEAPAPLSCASEIAMLCPEGQRDACQLGEPGKPLAKFHVCAPVGQAAETPCAQEIALACDEGQIDACLLEPPFADVHVCVVR